MKKFHTNIKPQAFDFSPAPMELNSFYR